MFITDSNDIVMDWNGEQIPQLHFAPTLLPLYLYALMKSTRSLVLIYFAVNPWFRLTFAILFNFVLYASLSYAALRKLGWLKSGKSRTHGEPQSPSL